MKTWYILLFLCLGGQCAFAQNLVVNPSFEDTTLCDTHDPLRTPALHWYNANTATPDIWDCDTVRRCGEEMDPTDDGIAVLGYKRAFDGDRFAAGFHWFGSNSSNTREYLMSRLASPLIAGMSYRVSLWCARPTGMNGAIDHIGVYLSHDSVHEDYPTTLPFVPQVQLRDPNSDYITDTAWVQLVDTILADGDEEWIVLGTFLDANDVNGIWLGWGSFPPTAYYYTDLLELRPLEQQSVVSTLQRSDALIIEGAWMVWRGGQVADQLAVYDMEGREVWSPTNGTIAPGRYAVPDHLSAGVYVAVVRAGFHRFTIRFIK